MTAARDLDAFELQLVDRGILADRLEKLQAERAQRETAMAAAMAWAAEEYRKCIVGARVTHDSDQYATCNGRAEAYRQLCEQVAEAAGVAAPDWEAIKRAVPVDGIYR